MTLMISHSRACTRSTRSAPRPLPLVLQVGQAREARHVPQQPAGEHGGGGGAQLGLPGGAGGGALGQHRVPVGCDERLRAGKRQGGAKDNFGPAPVCRLQG